MSSSGSGVSKPSARAIYEQRKKYSSYIMNDVSQYTVNHLMTFPLGEAVERLSVEEAVQKVAAMEAQGKLWAQEMLLQVTGSAIRLLDIHFQEELENYRLPGVLRCEAVLPTPSSRTLLLLVCQELQQPQPDAHFFQCDHIGAELIREDINSALLDFKLGGNAQRKEALRVNQEKLQNVPPSAPRGTGSRPPPPTRKVVIAPSASQEKMETQSQRDAAARTSLRTERDVELLNRVFDDIEAFVGKLQKSAEAHQVLEQLKRSSRGRRRQPGEGLLTLRARPPAMEEFEDTLAKMKYSFSLLARLQSNISNPTSEELVHVLFAPLKMVVEASGGPEFASEICLPMLTSEAVTLLRSCLEPQETELWRSLGNNWARPRVEFPPDHAASYTPSFCSGWVPPGQPWEDPVEAQHLHEARRAQQSAPPIEANGHRHAKEGQLVSCTYDFVARNNNEMSVLQGEILEVLDNSKKWWKVQKRSGQQGYVPYNILRPLPAGQSHSPGRPPHETSSASSSPGQSRVLAPPALPASTKSVSAPNGPNWNGSKEPGIDPNERERLNEELLQRLAAGRATSPKPFLVQRTPDTSMPLDYDSDPAEVQAWLEAKGFGPLTVSTLGVLNGSKLFLLSKADFQAASPEEGARVYSQVTVHKAMLEDVKKVSELEAVMEKQKRKLEGETGASRS
ncbi:epidermal growth factor receptor kinase substrate 8-like protein 1 [Carettochelys insculpta]|uniref:epidermal growth factor receptor kinase substrate 8-like protein 1 n=1 Tax=Carettochelys insculpta TaxID=44489 RepID=UPI003EC09636